MKKLLALSLLSMSLVGIAHADGNVPFDVEGQSRKAFPNMSDSPIQERLIFTATSNQEVVQNVILNRGNCKMVDWSKKFPATLKYGEQLIVYANIGCSVREAVLQAGSGEYTFTWKN